MAFQMLSDLTLTDTPAVIDQDIASAFCALFNGDTDPNYRAGLAFLLSAYGETEDLALMIKAAAQYAETPEYVPTERKQ